MFYGFESASRVVHLGIVLEYIDQAVFHSGKMSFQGHNDDISISTCVSNDPTPSMVQTDGMVIVQNVGNST